MTLPARTIDSAAYTGLIETLVGISIKMEVARQSLDPIDDEAGTKLVLQIRDDVMKAAVFAKVEPAEWKQVHDRMISALN